ncbi:hypothetical protein Ancab_020884 [Ancistrocladus abbreviatus]
MRVSGFILFSFLWAAATLEYASSHGDQPLSKVAIHNTKLSLNDKAYIKASPTLLGLRGTNREWVTVKNSYPNPSVDDWIGVFSPANFSPEYSDTGKGTLKLQIINQRSDFSFALFSGGILNPKLVAISNTITFANPKAPVYPRLAQGKLWNEMTVTWTSGYGINEAEPFVEWGLKGGERIKSPAGTLTFDRSSMCGP